MNDGTPAPDELDQPLSNPGYTGETTNEIRHEQQMSPNRPPPMFLPSAHETDACALDLKHVSVNQCMHCPLRSHRFL